MDADGFLFVLAYRGGGFTVLELDFDGAFRREVGLSGLPGDVLPPQLTSLAIAPAGDRLYLVDQANLRLWIADRDGAVQGSVDLSRAGSEERREDRFLGHVDVYGDTVLLAVPADGQIDLFGLDGSKRGWVGVRGSATCKLGFPVAGALRQDGTAVIVDQLRMLVEIVEVRGNRCLGDYYGIGVLPGQLYFPLDIAVGTNGRLYVSQGFEGRVQVFDGGSPAVGSAAAAEAQEAP